MVLVAVAGVVLAVVLAALLVRQRALGRRLAASERTTAVERDRAVADAIAAAERAHAAEAALEEALGRASAARRDASEVARRLQDEMAARAAAELTADRLGRERARLEQEIEALRSDVDELWAELETTAEPPPAAPPAPASGVAPAEVVWELEMARIERMWRTSVAVDPFEEGPFDGAGEPLRAALEVLADAAHEDSGADIVVCWRSADDQPVPAARAVVVLALVEGIVSGAAKADHRTVVRVTTSADGVEVRLEGGDPDAELPVPSALVAGERRYVVA